MAKERMRVAIFGCGYLGLETGRQLDAAGYDVIGVRRSDAGLSLITDRGLTAVAADLTNPETLGDIPDVSALVVSPTPDARSLEAARQTYITGLESVIAHFGSRDTSPERLIYTSSTGVYGDQNGDWVTESTPLSPMGERAQILVEAEQLVREKSSFDWTIVRLAGIYGPERYRLRRYLTTPVDPGYRNLIHRDDAASLLTTLLTDDVLRNEVVNGVDEAPVSKWEFVEWLAAECGEEPPPRVSVAERLDDPTLSVTAKERIRANKRCSNAKLRSLDVTYTYPTFRSGYTPAVVEDS